jgi:hypothetical protein
MLDGPCRETDLGGWWTPGHRPLKDFLRSPGSAALEVPRPRSADPGAATEGIPLGRPGVYLYGSTARCRASNERETEPENAGKAWALRRAAARLDFGLPGGVKLEAT